MMSNIENRFSWEVFRLVPIIGIMRNIPFELVKEILPVYKKAGLNTLEITLNSSDAEKSIRYAVENYSDLNIGVGTVCSLKDLDTAMAYGAQFIVTPIVDKKIIKTCKVRSIPIFSGAFTPTEIHKAWKAGADMVKVFPATALGANFIKDIKGPFNQIKLLPTGGVSIDNIQEFYQAGASGFGIGSPLFNKKHIEAKDWGALSSHFEDFVKKITA
ncbi:bifunctional 4-hydroxy-2-oxoglutarate aldolase/2-dehydro-3-deoxy-phosphogluconate aldolase [Pedobacter arcticus]|uniref:bifunctional 4-hydroxy-2-oxoglutarate aldolase/2-dehydro-3-deoxy-phosphogluconate aldolase n=1 Tax=Pedobacter arcticus TaxID=752140 RepID=UPI00192ACCDA|nr:bifunctional 4-hydroxy-2-oxoglutarate aldolase/2-dehydro-3-deoxy-phosphogluconate aldolase [Pedobacter arcticus]